MPAGVDDATAGGAVEGLAALAADLEGELVDATDRAAIDRTVCERIAAAPFCRFVALFCHDDGEFTFRAAVGVEDETAAGLEPSADGLPARRAVDLRRSQAVAAGDDRTPARWREVASARGADGVVVAPVAHDSEVYRIALIGVDRIDRVDARALDRFDRLGAAAGRAIAGLERRKQERVLAALQGAIDRLRAAEDAAAVYETAVDVAGGILDAPGLGAFRFDPDGNRLDLAAGTDRLREFYGGETSFGPGPGDAEVWEAYVTGETRVFDDLTAADRLANPDTDAESAAFVPLSDHGVFVAASAVPGSFDTRQRRLLDLVATTATDALDRVARERALRDQRALLEQRAAELERLDRTGRLAREVTRVLIHAGSREELERRVCERLTDGDGFDLAWIGSVPPDGDAVAPHASAGDAAGYLEECDLTVDGEGAEPAARAAGAADACCTDVTANIQGEAWAAAAADRGFQSACAVPLVYRGTRYGVLAVYTAAPEGFGDVTAMLAELGEAVGYGISVVETRAAILADRAVELDLLIPDPGGFVNAVAGAVEEPVRYYELTPDAEAATRLLFALTDPPVEAVEGLAGERQAVDSLTAVSSDGEFVYRATVAGDTVPSALVDCGAIPQEVAAGAGETRATVRLPQSFDVRAFLDRLTDRYPGTEMLARRSVEGPARTREEFRTEVDAALTERQLEVLRTAFESGFFESPRETTGAQLADLLGVSQPTVTRHLREGQRRLFALLFEGPAE